MQPVLPNSTAGLSLARVILLAILFLFFFQLVADFVGAIYAFGLLGTSIPVELVAVLLFFSPVVLLLAPGRIAAGGLLGLSLLVIACRLVETLLDTRGRMLVSGVGVAGFLLLLPAWLWDAGQRERKEAPAELGAGLLLALAASILLRTLGAGQDLSTVGMFQVIGWGLALGGGALAIAVYRRTDRAVLPVASRASLGKAAGLSLGVGAVLVLLYFVFTAPHVLGRWSGVAYAAILPLATVILALFAWWMGWGRLRARLTPRLVLGWNALFVMALATTALVHQVAFPVDPVAYPLAEPTVTSLHRLPLFLTLLLYPVLILDFRLLTGELITIRPTVRQLGAGFSLASLLTLVLVLAHVFTTTYDYIPVIGPLFRDRFWLVHLAAGIVLLLAIPLAMRRVLDLRAPVLAPGLRTVIVVFTAITSVVAMVALPAIGARPVSPSPGERSLKVLTYNIQQGYSEAGLKNQHGQLALIRTLDPDLIGLQESDIARISGSNEDVVRLLADGLDMHAYYGPSTVAGTFGIALLSRYPIENAKTYYLFSEGEQVAVIEAQVTIDDRTFNVYVNHLGNGGPLIQQEQFLQLVAGKENIIAAGDYNFTPDTQQYRLTTAVLADSWTLRWPDWMDDEGQRPVDKIDHIFVSPGTKVLDARFIDSPASDHPAVTATLGW